MVSTDVSISKAMQLMLFQQKGKSAMIERIARLSSRVALSYEAILTAKFWSRTALTASRDFSHVRQWKG